MKVNLQSPIPIPYSCKDAGTACQKVCKQGTDDVIVKPYPYIFFTLQLQTSMKTMQEWGFACLPSLLYHSYTLFAYFLACRQSLHPYIFNFLVSFGLVNVSYFSLTYVSTTVKPLIPDPPKSRQPLYSGRLICPRLILP